MSVDVDCPVVFDLGGRGVHHIMRLIDDRILISVTIVSVHILIATVCTRDCRVLPFVALQIFGGATTRLVPYLAATLWL